MGNGILKSRRFYIALVIFCLLIFSVILYIIWLRPLSIDRQLAYIEAQRAIPDSENAAVFYRQFFQNFPIPPVSFKYMLGQQADLNTRRKSWRSSDHPELAALIKENHEAIAKFIEITKTKECRFPIPYASKQPGDPYAPRTEIREWLFFLNRAINNDTGDGRAEAAIDKYACILRLTGNLYQQRVADDYNLATGLETYPSQTITKLIVEGNMTDAQLDLLSKALLPTNNTWQADWKNMREIFALCRAKHWQQLGLINGVKHLVSMFKLRFIYRKYEHPADRLERQYNRTLAIRRGLHILVALRRYRNQQGYWPESLDVIAPLLPAEILNDTQRCGTFIYKRLDDDFVLYGTGPNGVDDGGNGRPAEDVPIWPTSRMLFEKRKKQNAR